MRFSFYIAKRYLISKKSRNVINIISAISVVGVATGTIALIVILSVFNGLDSLITSLFNSFDPDLKITLQEGKTFTTDNEVFEELKNLNEVAYYSEVIEENALLEYDKKITLATVKGVSEQFAEMSGVDSMMYEGEFYLKRDDNSFAVIGHGIAYYLSVGLNFVESIKIYVIKRSDKKILSAEKAINKKNIYPVGIFSIQQELDTKYILVPIDFARDLLNYENEVSAIELKLKDDVNIKDAQEKISTILGSDYAVKDRYRQHEMLYKIMQSEKWAIFLILTFILIIASFNIIGSLTMLIIDKKKDISILQSLGADMAVIRRIFLYEGWLICVVGAVSGLILGALICWAQQEFGLVKLSGSGSFVVDTYPVKMKFTDFVYVLITVVFIGFTVSWYPVRYITKKYMSVDMHLK